MAVEQTLTSLTRNTLICTPIFKPTKISKTIFTKPLKLKPLIIKSSYTDYNNNITNNLNNTNTNNTNTGYYYDTPSITQQYARPSEIEWKKELCNNVQLIGIVGAEVQLKELSSGKAVAWSRLAVKKSASDTTWINLTFWDELAHVASQHLEKGNQIYVSGRLVSDTVESEDGKQQTYYKVVVQQLNFIEKSFSSVSLYDGEPSSETTGRKNRAVNTTGSIEELWQAFFANPVDWWDNRKDKRNPKYPDFKHKDTGEALWIEGRYNPSWVKSQLEILDSKMESFHQQNSGTDSNFYTSF